MELDSKQADDDWKLDNVEEIDEDLNDKMDFISFMDKDPSSILNNRNRLTPEESYREYRKNPTKQNLNQCINSLSSTIRYSLASNNALGDPLLESKAKLLTAKAIKSFDTGYKVSLPTYVSSQLKKMTRIARDRKNPIKLPERFIVEYQTLVNAENELRDELGREPDLTELADKTAMPISKITKLRQKALKQPSETQMFNIGDTTGDNDESTASVDETEASAPDFLTEAQAYVYNDLDHTQKKVFEHLTGYGGSKLMDPKEISAKYKVSLPTISRWANSFANRINENYNALEEVYAK